MDWYEIFRSRILSSRFSLLDKIMKGPALWLQAFQRIELAACWSQQDAEILVFSVEEASAFFIHQAALYAAVKVLHSVNAGCRPWTSHAWKTSSS